MLFESYRITNKTSVEHFRHACYLGGVACAFSLLVLLSVRPADRILPWAVFGVTAGMAILLAGAFSLHRVSPQTRWGRFLKGTSDEWFPAFLFCMRKIFLLLFAILLWVTLQQLGFPSSITINSLFAMILLIIPIRGILREYLSISPTDKKEVVNDFFRYAIISISAILIVTVLTSLSGDPVTSSDVNMINIILWISALLVVATSLVLFLSRLPRHRPHPSSIRKRPQTFFSQDNNRPEY